MEENMKVLRNQSREKPVTDIADVRVEQFVLGTLIVNGRSLLSIGVPIDMSFFSKESHRFIFKAICQVVESIKTIDISLLLNQLRKNGDLEKAGDIEYVMGLSDPIISSVNLENHVKLLGEYAIRRKIIRCGSYYSEAGKNLEKDAFVILEGFEKEALEISKNIFSQGNGDFLSNRSLRDRKNMEFIPSGYDGLDEKINGFKKGNLIVVGGRTGMGKSAFMINLATSLSRRSIPVAYFSLEMEMDEILGRSLSIISSVPLEEVMSGNFFEEEKARLELQKFWVDDSVGLDIETLKRQCRILVARNGCKVIFVDYLQLIRVKNMPKNTIREQIVAMICRELKEIARELKITVVVGSQINRAADARASNKRPQLQDLRESGSIEQDSDIVLLLYRDSYYGDPSMGVGKNDTEIIVAKNRNGKTGKAMLTFEAEFCRFSEKIDEWVLGKGTEQEEDSFFPNF